MGANRPANEDEYSIYLSLNGGGTDLEMVRKHVDAGIMTDMLAKKETAMLSDETKKEYDDPGYLFILLLACAMSIGCTIPDRFLTTAKKVYRCVGFSHEGKQELWNALFEPDRFRNGKPYRFHTRGLTQKTCSNPHPFGAHMLNVPGPGTMFFKTPNDSPAGLLELKGKFNEGKHDEAVCGGCGAAEGKGGGALKTCAKCKDRKYCGTECQKAHWKYHKYVCVAPDPE